MTEVTAFDFVTNTSEKICNDPVFCYRDLKTGSIWSTISNSWFFILESGGVINVFVDMSILKFIPGDAVPNDMDKDHTKRYHKVTVYSNGMVQAELNYPLFVDHVSRVICYGNRLQYNPGKMYKFINITDFLDEEAIEDVYNNYFRSLRNVSEL